MDITRLVLFSFLIVSLSGCGGSSNDSSPAPTPAPAPTSAPTPAPAPAPNRAPEISLQQSAFSLQEQTSLSVGIQISDADGDTVTVAVDATDIVANYSESESAIIVEAPSVDEEQTFVLIVRAIDINGGTDEAELLITVTKKNEPPTVSFTNNTEYQAVERTFFTVPFEFNDSDTSVNDLVFSAVIGPNFTTDNEPEGFEATVDIENNILRVDVGSQVFLGFGDNNNHLVNDYTVTLSVSDGNSSSNSSFIFDVAKANDPLQINLDTLNVFIVQGNQKVLDYVASSDSDSYRIVDFDYVNEADSTEDRLDFSVDTEIQKVTFIAKPNSFKTDDNNSIMLILTYAKNDAINNRSSSRTFTVNIRDAISQNEIDIEDKINDLYKISSLGSEYESIAYFVNDYLYLNNVIDNSEYEINKGNISSQREFYYANGFGNVQYLREQLFLNDDLSLDEDYQEALTIIGRNINSINKNNLFFIVDVLNNLISQDPNSLFPLFSEEEFFDLNAEYPSRFIGNSKYGSYNADGNWNFNEEYRIIEPVIKQLLGRINWD
jgi:hypothetical protein